MGGAIAILRRLWASNATSMVLGDQSFLNLMVDRNSKNSQSAYGHLVLDWAFWLVEEAEEVS